MSSEYKLLPDSITAQVLIEEKGQKNPAQIALLIHGKKGKGKDQKGEKEKKKCTYCKKKGHLKKDCQKKKADKTKDDKTSTSNSSEKEKKEGTLTAKVATMAESSSNSKFFQLFVANVLTVIRIK